MSGHSKWASIKHKKAAVDAKKGRVFTKTIKELTVAARMGGGDADANPRLRSAIAAARAANMPNDNIQRAIKKGTGELPGMSYEEAIYEGYGPGGVAVMVQVLTDNKNRTSASIRSIFSKCGGNLGESGCVSWMFHKKGYMSVPAEKVNEDDLMAIALDAGAEDMKKEGDAFEVYTLIEDFEKVKKSLQDKNIPVASSELTMMPQTTIRLDDKNGHQMLRLMEALEDHEDVQNVYANFDIPEEVMAAFSA